MPGFEGTREQMRAHPVVRAWRRLGRAEPGRVDILKEKAKRVSKSMVYRLVGVGRAGSDVIAKRCRRATAELEHRIYAELLPRAPVRTLHVYGWVEEEGLESEVCWLFLEDATGVRYSPRSAEHRALAGCWLGHVHATAVQAPTLAALPEAGPPRYLAHLRSARATLHSNVDNPALTPGERTTLAHLLARLAVLEARWEQVEAWCEGMPQTLVHGDFVGKNVRVRSEPAGDALLPFDWEFAGRGVPAVDLAQPVLETTEFVSAPDLASYLAVVREYWPGMEQGVLQRVATCGTVFRCLAALDWKALELTSEWVDQPVQAMQHFDAELAEALRVGGWA